MTTRTHRILRIHKAFAGYIEAENSVVNYTLSVGLYTTAVGNFFDNGLKALTTQHSTLMSSLRRNCRRPYSEDIPVIRYLENEYSSHASITNLSAHCLRCVEPCVAA